MKSSKNARGKTMPESAGKGRQGVGGNGNLRPVRDGNERSRGRKAGVPNKTTRILEEAILQAAEELGELERRTAVIKSENAPVRKVSQPPLPGNPGRPLGSKNKVTQLEQCRGAHPDCFLCSLPALGTFEPTLLTLLELS